MIDERAFTMISNYQELIKAIDEGAGFTYTYFFRAAHPFSQFYEASFSASYKGKMVEFTCAEQFMMFAKALTFKDEETINKIIGHPYDPKFYKAMGRKVKHYDNVVWGKVRSFYVTQGNILKFNQNPELKAKLLATNESVLVEASPYDGIWGVGLSATDERIKNPKNWKGTNLLGFALMSAREQLSLK